MFTIVVKEIKLSFAMDDLDFRIKDVAFDVKVFNRYGNFDQIANKSMEDPSHAYLHYDLLTIITLNMKSPYIKVYEQHVQNGMFVKVKIFGIESKSKRGFKEVTCMLSLQLSWQRLCH